MERWTTEESITGRVTIPERLVMLRDVKDVWVQKGVGLVGEHYIHNGTYDEHTTKLVSFSH